MRISHKVKDGKRVFAYGKKVFACEKGFYKSSRFFTLVVSVSLMGSQIIPIRYHNIVKLVRLFEYFDDSPLLSFLKV